jgi:hypothetical protein
MSTPDQSIIATLVAAAATAEAQNASDRPLMERIADTAQQLAALASPSSDVGQRVSRLLGAKVFYGTITSVAKEESSTRAVVTMKTRPSKFHPDGIETVRTDRTDNPTGLAFAKKVQGLKGHRCRFYVAMEKASEDLEVRVLAWVDDLGVDQAAAAS